MEYDFIFLDFILSVLYNIVNNFSILFQEDFSIVWGMSGKGKLGDLNILFGFLLVDFA